MKKVHYNGFIIGVAPTTHLRTCIIKIVHIQGRSPNVVSDFPYHKELLLKKRTHCLESTFFPLREVPILKKDAIEENHCLFQ